MRFHAYTIIINFLLEIEKEGIQVTIFPILLTDTRKDQFPGIAACSRGPLSIRHDSSR